MFAALSTWTRTYLTTPTIRLASILVRITKTWLIACRVLELKRLAKIWLKLASQKCTKFYICILLTTGQWGRGLFWIQVRVVLDKILNWACRGKMLKRPGKSSQTLAQRMERMSGWRNARQTRRPGIKMRDFNYLSLFIEQINMFSKNRVQWFLPLHS